MFLLFLCTPFLFLRIEAPFLLITSIMMMLDLNRPEGLIRAFQAGIGGDTFDFCFLRRVPSGWFQEFELFLLSRPWSSAFINVFKLSNRRHLSLEGFGFLAFLLLSFRVLHLGVELRLPRFCPPLLVRTFSILSLPSLTRALMLNGYKFALSYPVPIFPGIYLKNFPWKVRTIVAAHL